MTIKCVSRQNLSAIFTSLGWQERKGRTSHRVYTKGDAEIAVPYARGKNGSGDIELKNIKYFFQQAGLGGVYADLRRHDGNVKSFIKELKKA